MITVDLKRVGMLHDRLEKLSAKGIPFAQRNTINDMAFATQREARDVIRAEFTTRNQWTVRSVQVDRAKSTRDSALVGSTEKYMADQEHGAVGGPKNVVTPAAAGQPNRASVRTKVARRANRMNAIKLGKRAGSGIDARSRNIAAVKEAKAEGRKFVYLERGKVKGIYQVFGSKRKPRTRMVQNLTRRQRVVKAHPWLAPAADRVQQTAPRLYAKRLREQLQRVMR